MAELLTKQNFECDRYCGECCKKLLVSVDREDIVRIKRLGYKESDFLFKDPFNAKRFFLKKDERGWCVFLSKDKKGRYSCKVHGSRPSSCKKYPFFSKDEKLKSCLPQDIYPNVFINYKK
jgi:uncharacterized protein